MISSMSRRWTQKCGWDAKVGDLLVVYKRDDNKSPINCGVITRVTRRQFTAMGRRWSRMTGREILDSRGRKFRMWEIRTEVLSHD